MLATKIILSVILSISLLVPITAYAQVRPELCYEDVDDMCGLLSGNPSETFGALLEPLETQIGGFALVILWGGIMGALWFKTENIMLVGLVGVLISGTITGLSQEAQGIGMLMLGISFGVLLFQLIRQRPAIFS